MYRATGKRIGFTRKLDSTRIFDSISVKVCAEMVIVYIQIGLNLCILSLGWAVNWTSNTILTASDVYRSNTLIIFSSVTFS